MSVLTTSYAWGFEWAGWALGAAAAVLFLLAMFRDRSRGRRRCPKCWYSMEGAPTLVCPECGRSARTERRMFKTRRRWVFAAAGLALGAVAWGVAVTPRVAANGWAAALPTPALLVLIAACSWPEPEQSATSLELQRRYEDRSLGRYESYAIGRMIRWWTIDHRPEWPTGTPVRIRTKSAGWLSSPTRLSEGLIRAHPVNADGTFGEWFSIPSQRRNANSIEWSDTLQELGTLPDGNDRLTIEFELYSRPAKRSAFVTGLPAKSVPPAADQPPKPRWSGRITFPVRVGGTATDILSPATSPELSEEIRASLLHTAPASGDRIALPIRRPAGCDDVSVGLRVEFYRGSEKVAYARVWDNADPDVAVKQSSRLPVRWLPVPEIADGRIIRVDSVRVVGDPEMALLDFDRRKYWSGEFTFKWEAAAPPGELHLPIDRP